MGCMERAIDGPSVGLDNIAAEEHELKLEEELDRSHSPPPRYPISEPLQPTPSSPRPPPFSSLYTSTAEAVEAYKVAVTEAGASLSTSTAAPEYVLIASDQNRQALEASTSSRDVEAETKAALPQDNKGESSKKDDESEPPPAYSEGSSPLDGFTYLMAAAGGAASIITQVQQGAAPINTLGGKYDPASLQYMLEFFRNVAQTIPSGSNSPSAGPETDTVPIEPMAGSAREMLQDRAGIIVLREDLDFYAIPPRADIEQPEMIEVKRAAGKALLKQDGIFSGLRRSEETGTTEQHLIEMLTAGGFNHDDHWGHRAGEPNKAVICSLALARLRTDIRGNEMGGNAVGMAQKLLLFWRKPARRCWWEGVELENVEGVEGKLKVWIRRVWTLEMSVIGLR
ncbi:hypothetical protein SS1G_04635 [Sclerotinia sclerotiorum 1980 UF-70]|uniref:Uncharacterized protein n=1 Tax=Sclerotinia sclerotiorum (strain ATCC 18683 / 1980 / Ss-1) TaxID=665079 RepID=A7EH43_SCLS1|nr:hypothetical protein SS1G_04635 [Sclerotinia sclerotiorum 1980 UF-70]EDO02159.1 hypothetical protein SS1G_04635 [Sclerotinia sclerotiorum 1980 UF-70]